MRRMDRSRWPVRAVAPLLAAAILGWLGAVPARADRSPEGGRALSVPLPRPAPAEPRPAPGPAPSAQGRPASPPAGDAAGHLREGGARLDPPTARDGSIPAVEGEREEEWKGPRVELGYARYRFSDGNGGGSVNALHFGGYLPTGAARLGMYGELALRDYTLEPGSDAIVRATLVAGYQHWRDLGPFVPYLVAVGTGGVLFGKRFHTPVSHTLWGAGLELGADLNLVGNLWAGGSFSWIRVTMRGLSWDLVMFRVRVGL